MVLNAAAPLRTDQHGISNQPCKGRTNGDHPEHSSTARQQRRKEQEQGSAMSKSFWRGRQLRFVSICHCWPSLILPLLARRTPARTCPAQLRRSALEMVCRLEQGKCRSCWRLRELEFLEFLQRPSTDVLHCFCMRRGDQSDAFETDAASCLDFVLALKAQLHFPERRLQLTYEPALQGYGLGFRV